MLFNTSVDHPLSYTVKNEEEGQEQLRTIDDTRKATARSTFTDPALVSGVAAAVPMGTDDRTEDDPVVPRDFPVPDPSRRKTKNSSPIGHIFLLVRALRYLPLLYFNRSLRHLFWL